MLDIAITQLLFYAFAVCAIIAALGVVIMRNPVSSAMCMAICFGFVAAIFFGLGAEFLGIIQITVYAGAVLVLFLFIVMMLDIKHEEKGSISMFKLVLCTIVAGCFAGIVTKVSLSLPGAHDPRPCTMTLLWDGITGAEESSCKKSCTATTTESSCTSACCAAPKKVTAGTLPELKTERGNVSEIGEVLFTRYPIHFAILSLTLLAACVGAIAISRKIRQS